VAFKDSGEEVAFFGRVLGVGLIIASPLVGPAAPALAGIGAAAIAGASVGSKIANRTSRNKRDYKPSTEERVSSSVAGVVSQLDSGIDIVDKLTER